MSDRHMPRCGVPTDGGSYCMNPADEGCCYCSIHANWPNIWQCETCGSVYAEYINGCPHCWEAGIRSSVRKVSEIKQLPEVGQ